MSIKQFILSFFKIPRRKTRNDGDIPPPSPLRNYDTIGLVAPAGHGKTTFMWAAMGCFTRLDRVFTKSFIEPSVSTELLLKSINSMAEAAELPRMTNEAVRYELKCHQLPDWGDRFMLLEDRCSAALVPADADENSLTLITRVQLVLLNPDLFCSQADREQGLGELGQRLHLARAVCGTTGRRRIVVVISQADRILGLPETVRAHLRTDPLAGLWPGTTSPASSLRDLKDEFFSANYVRTLAGIDQILRAWLREYPGGEDFLAAAELARVDLRLCAVSALGSDPQDGRMLFPWAPRRVLDPFLWAWSLGAG